MPLCKLLLAGLLGVGFVSSPELRAQSRVEINAIDSVLFEIQLNGDEIDLSLDQTVYLERGNHQLRFGKSPSEQIMLEIDGSSTYQINLIGLVPEVLKGVDPTLDQEPEASSQTGVSLNGAQIQIVNQANSEAIEGARVFLHASNEEFVSGEDGWVEITTTLDLTHEQLVTVFHKNFSTRSLGKVRLRDPAFDTRVELEASGLRLEDFVVISPKMKSSVSALLEIRKNHASVADMIGSEQISRSGDSDAAASLKRVTGLSLVDGKFVYVRGLGERYSSTLLNGSVLPSPDPSRRVVPLDLFPASVIENMVVQKGYASTMPGEFGGGSIQIQTKDSDSGDSKVKYSIGRTIDPQSDLKSYGSYPRDWTGFGYSSRALPSAIQEYVNNDENVSEASAEERKALAQSLNKSYNTRDVRALEKLPFSSLSLSLGDSGNWGRMRWGYNLASIYGNTWDYRVESRIDYNYTGSELVEDSSQSVTQSTQNIKLAFLGGFSLGRRSWDASYATSILRNSEDLVSFASGVNSEDEDFRKTDLSWRERSLVSHQLRGSKSIAFLDKAKVKWNYTFSRALLQEPEEKMYVYKLQGDEYEFETENASAGNSTAWRRMPDTLHNILLDFEQPTNFLSSGSVFAFGLGRMARERSFDSKTYYFEFDSTYPDTVDRTQDPDTVVSHPSAQLRQQASQTDNYSADQSIQSYYVDYSLPFERWRISAGLRYEESVQNVESFQLFDAGKTTSRLETFDYFPNASLMYKINEKNQLRTNFSETVSRPDLREISNTTWVDVGEGAKFKGNPNLKAAIIQNWGARWEWFPKRGEVFSLGYFRKDFENPIEEIFGTLDDSGDIKNTTDTQYTFINIANAYSHGLEVEGRKKLPWGLSVGANYSWIRSEVEIASDQQGQLTSSQRALQGQSEYLFNCDLGFESKNKRYLANLLYNIIGPRITGVGVNGRPDEYQESLSSLDFVASHKFRSGMSLGVKVKNILDPERKRVQGGEITRSGRQGRQYSLSLKGEF